MKQKLLIALPLLASCTTEYYIPPASDMSATVSFSNLSPEIPEINIIDTCNSSKINNSYIEYKKPADRSTFKVKIPVKRKISFEYKYFWISGEKTVPVTTENQYQSHIELKKTKVISECTATVTFIPEENKHYEVYFGKNINKCVIKASEAYFSNNNQKQLLPVIITGNQKC